MNIFEEYKKVRVQLDELTKREEALKSLVLDEIRDNPAKTVENEYGSFTKAVTTKITYSPLCVEAETLAKNKIKEISKPILNEVEKLKKNEVEKGIAKTETSLQLRYSTK